MTSPASSNYRRCTISCGERGSRRWLGVSTPTIRRAARISRRTTSRRRGSSRMNPSRSPGSMKGMRSSTLQAILDIFRLSQSHSLLTAPTPKKEDITWTTRALITQKRNSLTFASRATSPSARNAPFTACIRTTRYRPPGRPSSRSGACCRKTSKNWTNRPATSWPLETRERSKAESGAKTAGRIKST